MTWGAPSLATPRSAIAALVWQPAVPVLAVSSAPSGGGIGLRRWVLNAQVPGGYDHHDPVAHLGEIAAECGVDGDGIGFLTAADVRRVATAVDGGVRVESTVGVRRPIWAAAPDADAAAAVAGTVNTVAWVPVRLSESALVGAVGTITEAKAQALRDLAVDGTGTPTDAVAVLCPADGPAEAYGGPRSLWGARLARAAWRSILEGGRR